MVVVLLGIPVRRVAGLGSRCFRSVAALSTATLELSARLVLWWSRVVLRVIGSRFVATRCSVCELVRLRTSGGFVGLFVALLSRNGAHWAVVLASPRSLLRSSDDR